MLRFVDGELVPDGERRQPGRRHGTGNPVRRRVLENAEAEHPVGMGELARRMGYTPAALYTMRSRLVTAGMIGGDGRLTEEGRQELDRLNVEAQAPPEVQQSQGDRVLDSKPRREASLDQLLKGLSKVKPMTELERRQLLTRLAQRGQDSIRVQAVKALEDMERVRGTQVGPPEPSDGAEQRERLVQMLNMIGKDQAVLAMAEAYPEVRIG